MAEQEKIPDAPLSSVTTCNEEDALTAEYSGMDSMATDGVDHWNAGNAQESVMSSGGSEQASHGAQALNTARAHLAAVAQELATIQNQFDQSLQQSAVVEEEEEVKRPSQTDILIQANQELEKEKRHLEVELSCAEAKATRLSSEKEALLAAEARLEADLRAVRKNLEDVMLYHQHTAMDSKKVGQDPDAIQAPVPAQVAGDKNPSALQEAAALMKPGNMMSKQQAIAALRATRTDLLEERKRREKLEKRVQKDKERLERLVAVAESQQTEIKMLQKRCFESEVCAEECLARLQESVAHSEALKQALQGPRPISKGSNIAGVDLPSRGGTPNGAHGNAVGGAGMMRQASAPTRLPSVVPVMAKR